MKGRNYRSPSGQAFTRMKYIHGSPNPKVSKFNMGDLSTHFPRRVHLVSREAVQIRHNALESGRVAANKVLFDKDADEDPDHGRKSAGGGTGHVPSRAYGGS